MAPVQQDDGGLGCCYNMRSRARPPMGDSLGGSGSAEKWPSWLKALAC